MTQQEFNEKVKVLEDQIKKSQAELEELKAVKIEVEQTKSWKPKEDETYYYLNWGGDVFICRWENNKADNWDYLTGNCFKTKEEAEEHKKQIEYTAHYKNYIEEHSEPIDWKNRDQHRYGAYYDYVDEKISIEETRLFKEQGKIYASSQQIIEDAIKEIGEDNFKKYVLEVK